MRPKMDRDEAMQLLYREGLVGRYYGPGYYSWNAVQAYMREHPRGRGAAKDSRRGRIYEACRQYHAETCRTRSYRPGERGGRRHDVTETIYGDLPAPPLEPIEGLPGWSTRAEGFGLWSVHYRSHYLAGNFGSLEWAQSWARNEVKLGRDTTPYDNAQ